jgi:secondary thiamine-phosphate synthase enzyme
MRNRWSSTGFCIEKLRGATFWSHGDRPGNTPAAVCEILPAGSNPNPHTFTSNSKDPIISAMSVVTISVQLDTRGNADIRDLTADVTQAVRQSGLQNGTVTIFCPSSTSALTTVEYEPGLVKDLRRLFDEIIPADRPYSHDAAWGDGNGHSHVRASLLGPSLTVPFVETRLTLGTWQQIIYVDFDNRARHRKLVVQIIGE